MCVSCEITSFSHDDTCQWNRNCSGLVRLVSNSFKTHDNRQNTCIHVNTHENTYWWSGTNYEPVWHVNWFRNGSLFAGYITYFVISRSKLTHSSVLWKYLSKLTICWWGLTNLSESDIIIYYSYNNLIDLTLLSAILVKYCNIAWRREIVKSDTNNKQYNLTKNIKDKLNFKVDVIFFNEHDSVCYMSVIFNYSYLKYNRYELLQVNHL